MCQWLRGEGGDYCTMVGPQIFVHPEILESFHHFGRGEDQVLYIFHSCCVVDVCRFVVVDFCVVMLFCVLYQKFAVFVRCLMPEVFVSAVKVSSYDCFDMSCADGVDDFVGWFVWGQ